MKGRWVGAIFLVALVFAPAQTAFAHGGNGGSASDYRTEVTGFDGDASGIELRSVELGNRMELVRTTAREVQILGYDGEPYLRLDEHGVFENVNSPAHYLNLDRFARQPVPASASATATPMWVKLSTGNTVRWHDHRTHWMDTTPRADVRQHPGVETVVSEDKVQLVIDGREVAAGVRVTWLPPPSRTTWLLISSLVACALIAALVLVPRLRWLQHPASLVAGAGLMLAAGTSAVRLAAGAVVAALAVASWLSDNRWGSLAAGGIATFLAVTHFEVFEHRLLAGWAPGVWQRVGIAGALACGAGVLAAQLVIGLGATEPAAPVPVDA